MRRIGVLIVLALTLAASQVAAAGKPDPAAVAANRALFDQVRTGQDQAVLAQLPPEANKQEMAQMLVRLKSVIPSGPPVKVLPVGASRVSSPKGSAQTLLVEYDFADRTVRFATTMAQPAGAPGFKLLSFSLLEASHKELQANTLSPDGRSPGQLVFFALAVTSPILMLAALVKVLRTPGLTYKWLWSAFAFVGLFSFKMNWATGVMLVQWMSLQIVGFWLGKGPSRFDPWMISATIPIGALLILAGLAARKPQA